MNLFKTILEAFYPNVCLGCSEIIESGDSLCEYCHNMLDITAKDKLCLKCGLRKKKCDCSKYIFCFDGCIAPFYYSGIAKRMMYRFKFRREEYISDYFAQQMALCIKQNYHNIVFDTVVYVPMGKLRELRRGYNQSKVLAEKISKLLNLPMAEDVLQAKGRRKIQHNLSHDKRFLNVKDKYYCKIPLKGKTVLLIDDIKTTGATLNQCALQLLKGGALSVYCATALITDNTKKKNKKYVSDNGSDLRKGNKNGN